MTVVCSVDRGVKLNILCFSRLQTPTNSIYFNLLFIEVAAEISETKPHGNKALCVACYCQRWVQKCVFVIWVSQPFNLLPSIKILALRCLIQKATGKKGLTWWHEVLYKYYHHFRAFFRQNINFQPWVYPQKRVDGSELPSQRKTEKIKPSIWLSFLFSQIDLTLHA